MATITTKAEALAALAKLKKKVDRVTKAFGVLPPPAPATTAKPKAKAAPKGKKPPLKGG